MITMSQSFHFMYCTILYRKHNNLEIYVFYFPSFLQKIRRLFCHFFTIFFIFATFAFCVSIFYIFVRVSLSLLFSCRAEKNKCFCCGLCGANNLWQTLNCMPLLLLLRFFCRFHSFIQNYKINCKND